MSEKIARLGIERDSDMMYYIKGGDVWATPRKQPGRPKGKARKIAPTGIELDYSKYLYFVDGDGDIARQVRGARKSDGSKKPAKAVKVAKTSHGSHADCPGCPECPPCPPSGTGTRPSKGRKKSEAQLEAEIAEVLAPKKPAKRANAR